MLEAKLKFFDLKKCGYYRRGKESEEFCNIIDTLEKLSLWSSDGREFVNTSCYEAEPDKDLFRTFYCSSKKNSITKDYLLVLWNELPNENGVMYGMSPLNQPGTTNMLATGFTSKDAIPGLPSYFWFIPEYNVFASVKFQHSLQGKNNLDHFLNGFLSNKSPYRVFDKKDDEKVIGYSVNAQVDETSAKLYPRFHAVARKNMELQQELIANVNQISKFIKRETLSYVVPDQRGAIEQVFSGLLKNTPLHIQERTINHELTFSPSIEQLNEIIYNYEELDKTAAIHNAGFRYKNGKKVMLSGIAVALDTEIAISRNNNEIISADILLECLNKNRTSFLNSLDIRDNPLDLVANL